jgi:hypothetical protein
MARASPYGSRRHYCVLVPSRPHPTPPAMWATEPHAPPEYACTHCHCLVVGGGGHGAALQQSSGADKPESSMARVHRTGAANRRFHAMETVEKVPMPLPVSLHAYVETLRIKNAYSTIENIAFSTSYCSYNTLS